MEKAVTKEAERDKGRVEMESVRSLGQGRMREKQGRIESLFTNFGEQERKSC